MPAIVERFDVEPTQSSAAFICGFVLMGVGVTYIGLFTGIIAAAFIESRFRKGIKMRKVYFEHHVLICGWDRQCKEILNQLFAPNLNEHRPVVLIDPT